MSARGRVAREGTELPVCVRRGDTGPRCTAVDVVTGYFPKVKGTWRLVETVRHRLPHTSMQSSQDETWIGKVACKVALGCLRGRYSYRKRRGWRAQACNGVGTCQSLMPRLRTPDECDGRTARCTPAETTLALRRSSCPSCHGRVPASCDGIAEADMGGHWTSCWAARAAGSSCPEQVGADGEGRAVPAEVAGEANARSRLSTCGQPSVR